MNDDDDYDDGKIIYNEDEVLAYMYNKESDDNDDNDNQDQDTGDDDSDDDDNERSTKLNENR